MLGSPNFGKLPLGHLGYYEACLASTALCNGILKTWIHTVHVGSVHNSLHEAYWPCSKDRMELTRACVVLRRPIYLGASLNEPASTLKPPTLSSMTASIAAKSRGVVSTLGKDIKEPLPEILHSPPQIAQIKSKPAPSETCRSLLNVQKPNLACS